MGLQTANKQCKWLLLEVSIQMDSSWLSGLESDRLLAFISSFVLNRHSQLVSNKPLGAMTSVMDFNSDRAQPEALWRSMVGSDSI